MFVFVFMLLLLLILSAIDIWIEDVNLKPIAVLIAIGLFVLAATRKEGFDRDYENYVTFFSNTETPLDYFRHFADWQLYEPTYYLIPSSLKQIVNPAIAIAISFALYALLGVFLKLVGILRLSNFCMLSVAIYFSNYFMLHELTQIRVGVASGIFLASIPLLYQKSYAKYVSAVLVACMFHFSAVVVLPLMVLRTQNVNRWIYAILLSATALFAFIDTSFVFEIVGIDLGPLTVKTETYKDLAELEIETFGEINKLNSLFLLQFIFTSGLLYYANEIRNNNPYAPLLIKIQIIGLFCFQLFSSIPALAFRISEMFLVVHVITFTLYAFVFKSRWMGYAIGAAFSITLFMLNIYYNKLFLF